MSSEDLQVIFLGLGIVFFVLAVIYLVMVVMNAVARRVEKKKAAPADPAGTDEETAAVITAVVAACMGRRPEDVTLGSVTEIPVWQPSYYNTEVGGDRNEDLSRKDQWKRV